MRQILTGPRAGEYSDVTNPVKLTHEENELIKVLAARAGVSKHTWLQNAVRDGIARATVWTEYNTDR